MFCVTYSMIYQTCTWRWIQTCIYLAFTTSLCFFRFVWQDENVFIFLCSWHILRNWNKNGSSKNQGRIFTEWRIQRMLNMNVLTIETQWGRTIIFSSEHLFWKKRMETRWSFTSRFYLLFFFRLFSYYRYIIDFIHCWCIDFKLNTMWYFVLSLWVLCQVYHGKSATSDIICVRFRSFLSDIALKST